MESSANKATVLNNYFYNNFNRDFSALQNSDSAYNFEHLIPKDCSDELLCTEDAIFDLLISLDTTKSVGTDGISAKMLKCTATSIASHFSLTTLCNLSISTGVFPTAWKEGRIIPVPNGTNKTSPTGYRPISILPGLLNVTLRQLLLNILNSVHQFHLGNGGLYPPSQLSLLSLKWWMTGPELSIKDLRSALCSLI